MYVYVSDSDFKRINLAVVLRKEWRTKSGVMERSNREICEQAGGSDQAGNKKKMKWSGWMYGVF